MSFREIPALLAALGKLRVMPDLLFCDGQGYAHPRRMGLATHLGIVLDRPAIGCAKSILIGTHGPIGNQKGEWTAMMDGEERIGAALRTRAGVKPVYVSQGHRIFAGERGAIRVFGLRWATYSAADAGCGSLCK